jgi:hypothetical protein
LNSFLKLRLNWQLKLEWISPENQAMAFPFRSNFQGCRVDCGLAGVLPGDIFHLKEAMRHFHISSVLLASWSVLVGVQPQTQYVISLEVISSLAPCASSRISRVVQQFTSSACLMPAAALASCACTDPQSSSSIASSIASNVREGCGTIASEDVNSALTVFSVYYAGGSQTAIPGPSATLAGYIADIQAISWAGQCASSGLVKLLESSKVSRLHRARHRQ